MNTYYGGEPVEKGVYLNLQTLEFTQVREEAPILPGARENRFIKTPGLLAVVAGPVAGLAFVLFLPFVGLVSAVTFLAYKAMKLAQALGNKLRPADVALEPKIAPAHGAGDTNNAARNNRQGPRDEGEENVRGWSGCTSFFRAANVW